jgi:hypothetical protein
MTGDLPPALGDGPSSGPPSSPQWTPALPAQPPLRPKAWSAIALAAIAALLAAAALVAALTRPTGSPPGAPATTSTAPSYTPEQTTAAHKQLCDTYKLAARSVQIETNSNDRALAGVGSINAALMLEQTLRAAPAIAADDRAAALALAAAYTKATAMGSTLQRDDPDFRSEIDDVNAKDAAMKKVCGDA